MENRIGLIKERLTELHIEYKENYWSTTCQTSIPLLLPKYRIAIFNGHSQDIYDSVKAMYAPLFIRDGEADDFVLEKLVNLLQFQYQRLLYIEQKKETKERNREKEAENMERHYQKVAAKAERLRKELMKQRYILIEEHYKP